MKILFFSLLLVGSFTFSQAQPDEELIRKARQPSNDAIARRDLESIGKFLLDDFVIIRGNGTIEIGKARNTQMWKKMIEETPQTYFERVPAEIIISKNNPNLAWESGNWKGFNTYSKGGRYSAQWKKKDGEWKLQAELFVAIE
jgi:ketosteroid isomerase-like protein